MDDQNLFLKGQRSSQIPTENLFNKFTPHSNMLRFLYKYVNYLQDKNKQDRLLFLHDVTSDEFLHDFIRAAVDASHAAVGIGASNVVLPHVTSTAVELNAISTHPVISNRISNTINHHQK